MRIMGLFILITATVGFCGCATFQRSEVIETDQLGGFAAGTYRDNSSGKVGTVDLAGSGAGWGSGGIGGLGAVGLGVKTGPPPSGALNFARAIAMINYSKKLKSVKYDQYGGVIDYEFEQTALTPRQYRQPVSESKLPSSFGHQPVE
jgi:hypothetical protein